MNVAFALLSASLLVGVLPAQLTSSPPAEPASQNRDAGHPDSAAPQEPSAQPTDSPAQTSDPRATVLFERSQPAPDDIPDAAPDAPGAATLKTRNGQPAEPPRQKAAQAANPGPTATDAERSAPTFTAYDLDVRLVPAEGSIAVRAKLTVRNDGAQPLGRLPLQISSSLAWIAVQADGRKLALTQQTIDSDVDHTGAVDEALVQLPAPLAPGASITLEALYSGAIPENAERLERIGAPRDQALASDWDRIAPAFTGLRGFGNVLWYPCSSPSLALGDGARLFNGVDAWKLRQSKATVAMRVQVEYRGDPPTVAVLDGQTIAPEIARSNDPRAIAPSADAATPSSATAASNDDAKADADTALATPRTATFLLPAAPLDFQAPSLFLVTGTMQQQDGIRIWLPGADRPTDDDSASDSANSSSDAASNDANGDARDAQHYFIAATVVQPMYEEWFGPKTPPPLTLIDLPDATDQPFNAGPALFVPLRAAEPRALAPMFSSALAAVWFPSPRLWMREGMAQFLSILWTERTIGRAIAMEQLEAQRSALALAEPETPSDAAGQSLDAASDPIFHHTKAAYVWWMLRAMVGDAPLQAALRQYRPEQDTAPDYFERLLEAASGKDLHWFFNDWVYRDRGLPDLSIAAVVPRRVETTGDYLVAVEVANAGYAAAEVPVTLHSGPARVTDRLLIPGRSRATTRILIQGVPDEVDVNDGSVPESGEATHRKVIEIAERP